MEINLIEDQILYWPKTSDYNYRWNFEVVYSLVLCDKKSYKFKSKFIYHTKEKKIYYRNISDYIQFKDLDWDWENKFTSDGVIDGFGSTTNFIFYCTKYIGEFKIEEDKRDNVFSGTFNPFNFSMEGKNNEMNLNRKILRDWWLENEKVIIDEIILKKDHYNSLISSSLNEIMI